MSEIKKELWKLSEKMEIEGKSSTIAGQINIMNRALDGQAGDDIADAIKKYTEVAGCGGSDIGLAVNSNLKYTKIDTTGGPMPSTLVPSLHANSNMTIEIAFSDKDGVVTINTTTENNVVYGDVNKIVISSYMYYTAVNFKAGDNFDGVYINGSKKTISGVTITAGNWYTTLIYQDDIKETIARDASVVPIE
jgi:hypothetical protein